MNLQHVSESERFTIARWASYQTEIIGEQSYLTSEQVDSVCNILNEGRALLLHEGKDISQYSLLRTYHIGKAYLLS
jgi:hypothetical protein